MLFIIIFSAITILLIVIGIISDEYIGLIAILPGVILFGILFAVVIVHASAPGDIVEYENTKNIIRQVDGITIEERGNILNKCVSINEKILKARAYKGNPWTGIFFSQKIANLELIDLSELSIARNRLLLETE